MIGWKPPEVVVADVSDDAHGEHCEKSKGEVKQRHWLWRVKIQATINFELLATSTFGETTKITTRNTANMTRAQQQISIAALLSSVSIVVVVSLTRTSRSLYQVYALCFMGFVPFPAKIHEEVIPVVSWRTLYTVTMQHV